MPGPSGRECMHEGVISCTEDTGIEEVARETSPHRISALVVVEGGVAVGVISQTDLVNATFVQPYLHHWPGMAAPHLPRTRGGERPVGILWMTDVVQMRGERGAREVS